MATLRGNKKALRQAIAATLKSLTPAEIHAQSQAITKRIISSPFFQRSGTISCYLSMPTGEVDTSSLVSEILRNGKALFVPKIDVSTNGRMEFLRVHGEDDLRSFPSGTWGIKEPGYQWLGAKRQSATDDSCEQLDLIFVPGVAFDHSLSRLGHGKGYYDRFLSTYTSMPGRRKPLLVAIALREQILEAGQVPMGNHDWKVDMIVGPDGIVGTQEEYGAGP